MPSAEYEVKWTPEPSEPSEPIVETYSHIPFAAFLKMELEREQIFLNSQSRNVVAKGFSAIKS